MSTFILIIIWLNYQSPSENEFKMNKELKNLTQHKLWVRLIQLYYEISFTYHGKIYMWSMIFNCVLVIMLFKQKCITRITLYLLVLPYL